MDESAKRMRRIVRTGTNIAVERERVSDGGVVRFMAYDIDSRDPVFTGAFRDEAEKLCPEGYELFEEKGQWLARPESANRKLEFRILRDRFNKPLVILESPLGSGHEIHPNKLRILAAHLVDIADRADALEAPGHDPAQRGTVVY